ncbi:MAG: PEP-CTERM sorting domain-containing protein [Planctomycetaceae bacterium]|nr:PEP-CTERM sorting domain-containing protein [Planctomycetaceae bacterium]
MKTTCFAMAILAMLAVSPAVDAATIVNGDFEAAPLWTGWNYYGVHKQSNNATDHLVALNPLSSGDSGYITQTIATVAGQQYELLFDLNATAWKQNYDWAMAIVIDGGSPTIFHVNTGTYSGTQQTPKTQQSLLFTATGASTELRVEGRQGLDTYGFYGAMVDNFSLTEVDIPEPATMSLLAVGGVAALIRRRKMT